MPSVLCPLESEVPDAQILFFHMGDVFSQGRSAGCVHRPLPPEVSIPMAHTDDLCHVGLSYLSSVVCSIFSALIYRLMINRSC